MWCRLFFLSLSLLSYFICFLLIYTCRKITVLFIDFIPTASICYFYKNVTIWCISSCQLGVFWKGHESRGWISKPPTLKIVINRGGLCVCLCVCVLRNTRSIWLKKGVLRDTLRRKWYKFSLVKTFSSLTFVTTEMVKLMLNCVLTRSLLLANNQI